MSSQYPTFLQATTITNHLQNGTGASPTPPAGAQQQAQSEAQRRPKHIGDIRGSQRLTAKNQQFTKFARANVQVSLASGVPFAQRLLDVLLAGSIVVAVLPVLLVAMLLVRLSTPGPVFVAVRRTGTDGKAFTGWVLRTTDSANRETAVGGALRALRLDTLPLLFSVLKGSTSLLASNAPLPHLA